MILKNSTEKIAVIVLAAGESKRLGKPKQSLYFQGETLLKRAVKAAVNSPCRPVIVVLGANAQTLKPAIEALDVEIVENSDWKNGMGSSIRSALKKLLENYSDAAGVILTVCDQPFVSAQLLAELVEKFLATDAPIVACAYGETIGVPALFSRRLFPELLALKAGHGAKKIIYEHLENVVEIVFEAGAIDVDTERDYLNLIE